VGQGVDRRRLRLAGQDEARAAVSLEVGRDGLDEGIGGRRGGDRADGHRHGRGEGLDLGRRHRTTVVGAGARQRRGRLDDVEAVGRV
jgi:hypothetical protein